MVEPTTIYLLAGRVAVYRVYTWAGSVPRTGRATEWYREIGYCPVVMVLQSTKIRVASGYTP
jgi:hypothetical protein